MSSMPTAFRTWSRGIEDMNDSVDERTGGTQNFVRPTLGLVARGATLLPDTPVNATGVACGPAIRVSGKRPSRKARRKE
jgi:hypothetical protein